MKVLLLNSFYFPYFIGGAEKSTQLLAEGLAQLGLDPVVAAVGPVETMAKIQGIKVHYVRSRNLYWPSGDHKRNPILRFLWHLLDTYHLGMSREVGKIIAGERPDLVHTHNLGGFSVAAWKAIKRQGLPLVHTIHDYYLLCPRTTMFRNGQNCHGQCWQCRLFSIPKRSLSSLVDHVIGVSAYILQRHCQSGYFPRARRSVIFNPVAVQKKLGKSRADGRLKFGYIGRLAPNKGVETLLEVFSHIDQQRATLSLAGDGKAAYVSHLRQRYSAPNIAYLGFVPAEQLYSQVDVVIVPSIWQEPLPRVVLEAYSHGLPVLAANRGGISEILENGKTGFLFDPSEPRELHKHIEHFLTNPHFAQGMRPYCQAKADEFSLDKISRQYLSVYKTFLRI